MKGIIIIVVMLVLGAGGGIGAGLFFAPDPDPALAECDPNISDSCEPAEADTEEASDASGSGSDDAEDPAFDYVKLANQFVVPIVRGERVAALVVVSITLEVEAGASASVFDKEPKIRDAFLQEMFDFAYLGGFDGPFTNSQNLMTLRRALLEIGTRIAGPIVEDVLIVDLVRQEV